MRECKGSLQLWQCGRVGGPCRDSDAWEAPDGFAFRVASKSSLGDAGGTDSNNSGGASEVGPTAPRGEPFARPPFHMVPM